jgi:hypothetical protein
VEILYAVPVGAVIAWYPPGSSALPQGFALCDGSIVTDAASPFNGKATPNLISRFILGTSAVATPPASGGSVDFNLSPLGSPSFAVPTGPTTVSGDVNDNVANVVIIRNGVSNQYRFGMVGEDPNSGWHDGNHNHTVAIPAPGWVGLLFIIRIK